tara:strand:- start:1628 stop:3172 length:1545 start_codon:yes stop_codon:yes gene_type:complete
MTNPNKINPVDYYNRDYIQDCIEKLLDVKSVHQSAQDALTYVTNKSDYGKRMVTIENNQFTANENNGFNMPIGEPYSPFMMLQSVVFKGSFKSALGYVIFKIMGNEVDFVRVGIKYFKKIVKVDRYEVLRTDLKLWDKTTIVDDYGKDFISNVPSFDDFTIQPDNKNYQSIINNNYNLYAEFSHKPCLAEEYNKEGWKWTRNLLKHIFQEHYELSLVYLKVLYQHPKQSLPILVLTSEERSTGKSTFVNWFEQLFGDNMVVVNPADIGRDFNGSYASKNIIAIEESRFDKASTLEKLKNLATQKKITVNSKFTPEYSVPFYGKLIITSNDENKFSKVDSPEIRYWVRKVPSLVGVENHDILTALTKEIPTFLHYLNMMRPVDLTRSRMVFTAEQIETKALNNVKKESRSELHKEIDALLDDFGLQNDKIVDFKFIGIDLKKKFFDKNNQYSNSYISKTLKHDMKLSKVEEIGRYIPLEEDGLNNHTKTGKPFIYPNKHYKINGSEIEDKEDVPF